jgi:hypothetical protein
MREVSSVGVAVEKATASEYDSIVIEEDEQAIPEGEERRRGQNARSDVGKSAMRDFVLRKGGPVGRVRVGEREEEGEE